MITLVLLAVAVTIALKYIIEYILWVRRAEKLTVDLPSWTFVPFLGQAYKFIGNTEVLFRRLIEISDRADEKGGRFKLWMGPRLFIFTTVPEDIKVVNNTFLDKPFIYSFADLWVKNGIAVAPGHIWKKTIKRVHIAFSASVTDGFQDVYNSYARKLTANLKSQSGKQAFDVSKKCISHVILEAICHTVFGVENIDNTVVTDEYYQSFTLATRLLIERSRNPLVYSNFIYEKTNSYKKFKKCVSVLKGLSSMIIETKRKEIEERKKFTGADLTDESSKPKFRSLLDSLLELTATDPTLTDVQIQADTDNFIAAGYETTAMTTLLILIYLGSHPRVQEKLYAEVKEIFQDSDRDVTKDDLERLVYCEAVISETLRMCPVVPVVMRHADYDLKLDGYTVPQGAEVVVFPWGTCHSRRNWGEDAHEFIPERWFRDNLPDPAAFLAFSYGRRICIAKHSAMVFLKIILAHCVREVIFKADSSKLRFEMNISLYPVANEGRYVQVFNRKETTKEI